MKYIAHISEDKSRTQTSTEHCINTAKYAKELVNNIGFNNLAYISGLLHDCGKFTEEFNDYITKASEGEQVHKGSVIHTFAGVYYILNKYHDKGDYESITAEIIALAIGCHHGLFDVFDENHNNGFEHRLSKQPEYEEKAIKAFFEECISEEKLDDIFNKAVEEVQSFIELIECEFEEEYYYYTSMLSKLIISAVIDADRRDTAEFMYDEKLEASYADWNEIEKSYNKFTSKFVSDTPIKKARREMSDICYNFANEECGIYRLDIPTGGGKTLSGLRYAIKHSSIYNKNRIFYVAPFITILEQNAEVIRNAVGKDNVLECHSNVIRNKDDGEKYNSLSYYLEETWNEPIIVTTLVQILNALFSGKTSSVRKLNKFCNSVIIFDEVQSIPKKMLSMFNLAINFLSKYCNTTIVLCSATQPCFENLTYHMNINEKAFLTKEQAKHYYNVFKRTNIIDDGKQSLESIKEYILDITRKNKSTLVVCNKVKEAVDLYNYLKECNVGVYHLSSNMCMAHRRDILEEVNYKLNNKLPVVCVSTQVIEAGVDVSFDTVIRYAAGMDSIVQSAGRCNRHGDNDVSTVRIINVTDEKLDRLKDIWTAKESTVSLLDKFKKNKERYDGELDSALSIAEYYKILFDKYEIDDANVFNFDTDTSETIFEMLSSNVQFKRGNEKYFVCQALKTAGEKFEVFDACNSNSVFVYYKESADLIGKLYSDRCNYDRKYLKDILTQLKPYSITIYSYQEDALRKAKAIKDLFDGAVCILDEDYYGEVGLNIKGNSSNSDDYIL